MNNNTNDPNVKYSSIRVYSNTQNGMALGILHGYLKKYPQTTLSDLRKAFPDNLNPDSGVKHLFIPIEKVSDEPKWDLYFREDESLLRMSDGVKVAVASQWSNASLECLSNHAKKFGIEMANFEFGEKYDKCGFRLECVTASEKTETQEKGENQVQTPASTHLADEKTPTSKILNEDKTNNKKNDTKMEKSKETTEKDDETKTRIPWWMWLLLLLLAGAAVGAFYLGRYTKEAEIRIQESGSGERGPDSRHRYRDGLQRED